MARHERLLPIRAPEIVHKRLKEAAEALTERNKNSGILGKVSANDVGLQAVIGYLERLSSEGIIKPITDDEPEANHD